MAPELGDAALKAINQALARALHYAPATRQRLKRLSPQVWRIRLDDLDITLDLEADADSLLVAKPDDRVPDASISGPVQAFVTLIQSSDKTATLASTDLRVEGSTRAFMQLQDLLQSPDFDAEAALGDLIGDMPAHFVAELSRRVSGDARRFIESLAHASGRYVVREKRWLVSTYELDALRQRVHQLRRRIDRLSALDHPSAPTRRNGDQ